MTGAAAPWRAGAAATGLAVGAAVILAGLGDVLVSRGRAADAARLPGNATLPASVLLEQAAARPADAASLGLARRALAAAPLSSEALALLARDAARRGRAAQARRLLALAGRAGWRDAGTRRLLYNAALAAGDARAAARHADALLRQGQARTELFAAFDRGLAQPAFRAALMPYLATTPGWPRDYLATHGAGLADAVLAEVVSARAQAANGLPRDLAGPLIATTIQAGRGATAAAIWRHTAGADGIGAGMLPWSRPAAIANPTLFDWQVPTAYRAAIPANSRLRVPTVPGTPPAARLVALPPGRYALAAHGAGHTSWLWALDCAGTPRTWPARPINGTSTIAISADCPAQWLSIAPGPDASAGLDGPVSVVALQP